MGRPYEEYFRLPGLLGQRHPRTAEHDELLFITVHQTCELWFRQILTELTAARDDMLAGETYLPRLRLRRCDSREPTVWHGFLAVLAKAGFPVATHEERAGTYREIAADRAEHESLWELAEAMVDHDHAWSMFCQRHLHTIERQIGHKPGTAGTSGVRRLPDRGRFYPELWALRSAL